jgi:hypothetical protein
MYVCEESDIEITSLLIHPAMSGTCCLEMNSLEEGFKIKGKRTPRHNSFIDALFNQSVTLSQLQEARLTTSRYDSNGKTKVMKLGGQYSRRLSV